MEKEKEEMKPSERIVELCDRLTSSGHAPSKLSASEFHEIAEFIFGLNDGPKVVCLCGSLRFIDEFKNQELAHLKRGEIALMPCCMFTDIQRNHGEESDYKRLADERHKKLIDMADEVLVLNVGGYIGNSTRSEIEYAEQSFKPIFYLVPVL